MGRSRRSALSLMGALLAPLACALLLAIGAGWPGQARADGIYNLGDKALTTAVTGEVVTSGVSAAGVAQAYIDRLDGASAATLQVRFAYGSGGTSAKVYVQTSLDQGTTWIDIACAAFTTASDVKVFNLSGLTPKTTAATPTDGAMADNTALDGVLGDRLRVKVTSTGTYAGSTVISVRVAVR